MKKFKMACYEMKSGEIYFDSLLGFCNQYNLVYSNIRRKIKKVGAYAFKHDDGVLVIYERDY